MKKILLVFICLCMFVTLDLKVKGNEDSEVNVQNVLDTGRYYYNGIEYNVSSFKDNGELPPTYNNASPKNGMRFQTVNGPNNQTLYFQKGNDNRT